MPREEHSRRRHESSSPEKRERRDKHRSHASSQEEEEERRHHHRSSGHHSRSPEKKSRRPKVSEKYTESSASSSTNVLSADALARLDAANDGLDGGSYDSGDGRKGRPKMKHRYADEERRQRGDDRVAYVEDDDREKKHRSKRRVVSGGEAERGGGGGSSVAMYREKAKKKKWWIVAAVIILVAVIVIPVAVTQSKKNNGVSGGSGSGGSPNAPGSTPDQLGGISQSEVPAWAKGTYYDPFTWYDTQDFNTTITNETVGGLPIMGLNSTWDDSVAPNDNVPSLDKNFTYGQLPIRGVNVGGWLALEPFITPSLFNQFPQSANIVDEYTLTSKLGPALAATTLEKHYSTFINLTSFQQIRDAGFDHVRMPFSYWALTTYNGDPYVPMISWRYLLRGIEYARQCGLRVNLDFHGLPGSQNGWNHSGRQGAIGWLNGTDGALNGQRSLDLHDQLSRFFAQPRYKNVVAIYGLVNEPKMISLPTDTVLNWTTTAISTVRGNGITALISFADGFLGLPKWKGQFPGVSGLVLDAHQYVIFNTDQIAFDHQTKLNFACGGWAGQMESSMNTLTGYGPTLCGEWSQADTDCAPYLNNVNVGSRWEGTMNVGDASLNVLTPTCPLKTSQCSCQGANADPGSYTPQYKQWLYDNAIAQMISFETGWGWFYWTWRTETSVQWSWKLGMDAGILPQKVWDRGGNGPGGSPVYNCSGTAPTFAPLPENY